MHPQTKFPGNVSYSEWLDDFFSKAMGLKDWEVRFINFQDLPSTPAPPGGSTSPATPTATSTTSIPMTTTGSTTSTPTATASTTSPSHTHTFPSHCEDILTGVIEGLLSETDEVATCRADVAAAGPALAAVVDEFEDGDIVAAIGDLLGTVQPLVSKCGATGSDAQKLLQALEDLSPKAVEANFKAYIGDMFIEFSEASHCKDADDYKGAGVHLGRALRNLIEGEDQFA